MVTVTIGVAVVALRAGAAGRLFQTQEHVHLFTQHTHITVRPDDITRV